MPKPPVRRPALSSPRVHSPGGALPAHCGAGIVAEWQAHVDAGRIGRRLPPSPELAAQHRRNDAVFARHTGEGRW